MQSVFLSYHFNDPKDADQHDRDLANHVDVLLRSHGLNVVNGGTLGGGALTKSVMDRIDACDALVGLMTRRNELRAAGAGQPAAYTTHQWVIDETNHARAHDKRAIALVETGVDPGGAYQEHERIVYDRSGPLPAFLKLADTVGLWQRESGRLLQLQILPEALAEKLGDAGDGATCEYRLVVPGQRPTEWQRTEVVAMPGGTFIYASGVRENTLVQLRATVDRTPYFSKQQSQCIQVTLKRGQT